MRKITVLLSVLALICACTSCTFNPVTPPDDSQSRQLDGVVLHIYVPGNTNEEIFDAAFSAASATATALKNELAFLNGAGQVAVSEELKAILTAIVPHFNEHNTPTLASVSALWFNEGNDTVPSADAIEQRLNVTGMSRFSFDGVTAKLEPGAQLDLTPIVEYAVAKRALAALELHGVTAAQVRAGNCTLVLGTAEMTVMASYGESEKSAGTAQLTDLASFSLGIYGRYFYEGDRLYHHILDGATGYPVETDISVINVFAPVSAMGEVYYDAYSAFCSGNGADAKALLDEKNISAVIILRSGELLTSGGIGSTVPFVPTQSKG